MISNRFIELVDGSIMFIRRGEPPMIVPGYEQDSGDPYRFHPILLGCKARVYKSISLACCPEPKNIRMCEKYNYYAVSPKICKECISLGNSIPIDSEGIDQLESD